MMILVTALAFVAAFVAAWASYREISLTRPTFCPFSLKLICRLKYMKDCRSLGDSIVSSSLKAAAHLDMRPI